MTSAHARLLPRILNEMQTSVYGLSSHLYITAPFGDAYEKIGTIQRRLAWPLHKDDTLFQSGRPTGLNIYFLLSICYTVFPFLFTMYVLDWIAMFLPRCTAFWLCIGRVRANSLYMHCTTSFLRDFTPNIGSHWHCISYN